MFLTLSNVTMQYIDMTQLIQISRGDNARMVKYLEQFKQLIPPRIQNLREQLKNGDRKAVRQILHQMSPQLQFFGVPEVTDPIQRLAEEYETIPMEELDKLVKFIIHQLDRASAEVNQILQNL